MLPAFSSCPGIQYTVTALLVLLMIAVSRDRSSSMLSSWWQALFEPGFMGVCFVGLDVWTMAVAKEGSTAGIPISLGDQHTLYLQMCLLLPHRVYAVVELEVPKARKIFQHFWSSGDPNGIFCK